MAPQLATSRLRKELLQLRKDPIPGIVAEPDESNLLIFFYAIRGPADTCYESGTYFGKIKFPNEYPLKPPSIYMLTPSGRFKCNTKICMSMSDFHPESWNPLWSVSSIIQGIQSFMASEELTTGGMRASEADRKRFAAMSADYNIKAFPHLFGGNVDAAFSEAEEAIRNADKNKVVGDTSTIKKSCRRKHTKKKCESDTKLATEQQVKEKNIDETVPKREEHSVSEAEAEKRRKRNAKKRAKQKAKKAAEKSQNAAD
eukprot:CAMPEP_0178903016 /NCGR_PEP_ID=MMETSP0786-20121207/4926_1 /TAXON_ID=186022 /ORGANISM="Thalassionema frauenfeldii, Strain CCMP 1798" /LENGTH=256 /DNA_ID=CAMNT_0020574347 /DNA_START=69 /DNA_END=842 /DNA_ORIENTATION=+